MSSNLPRGATGVGTKTRAQNVNTVYAGRNPTGGPKAAGNRNAGLMSVGKPVAIRRMPPAITLPSLRAESQGQDPDVALVPQGGLGWNKSQGEAPSPSNNDNHSSQCSTQNVSSVNEHRSITSSMMSSTVDLRPTWAKGVNSQAVEQTRQEPTRDFPSLVSTANKDSYKNQGSNGTAEDHLAQLPSRFLEGNAKGRANRFQENSDSQSKHSSNYVSRQHRDSTGEQRATGDSHFSEDYGSLDYHGSFLDILSSIVVFF